MRGGVGHPSVSARRASVAGAALVVASAIALTACAGASPRRRIFLFGDSLVEQASTYWLRLMRSSGRWDARQDSFAGTAACDWFGIMKQVRERFRPQIVAMSFAGNDLTSCMRHPDGSQLSHAEFAERYRADTARAVAIFGSHVTFYLVAAAAMTPRNDVVFDIYRQVARRYPNARFVDGGRIVSPNRTWVRTEPCLSREPCLGPVVDGVRSNVVRSPDTVHFCPVDPGPKSCPVYSSGAYRFALTIFEAVTGAKG